MRQRRIRPVPHHPQSRHRQRQPHTLSTRRIPNQRPMTRPPQTLQVPKALLYPTRYRCHPPDTSHGGRSVSTIHASRLPHAHTANTVHSKVLILITRHRPSPRVFGHGTKSCNACHSAPPATSTLPSPSVCITGCAPNCRIDSNHSGESKPRSVNPNTRPSGGKAGARARHRCAPIGFHAGLSHATGMARFLLSTLRLRARWMPRHPEG
jgi:hypothetical protein